MREYCDRCITELVGKRFPFVLWNRDCVFTLLDILEVVGRSCSAPAGVVQVTRVYLLVCKVIERMASQTTVPLPDGKLHLSLPDSLSMRQQILSVRSDLLAAASSDSDLV